MKMADYPMLKSDPIGSTIYQKSVMNAKFVTLVEIYSAVISVHVLITSNALIHLLNVLLLGIGNARYAKREIFLLSQKRALLLMIRILLHSLNSLYALAEAGDQIEKKSHLITMFLQKKDRRAGWRGELPTGVGDAVLLKRENEENEQGLERATRYTVSGQALKDKYAKARQRQKRKIAKGIARQSSGLVETEPPIAIGLNREKSSAYDINSHKLEKPVSRSNR